MHSKDYAFHENPVGLLESREKKPNPTFSFGLRGVLPVSQEMRKHECVRKRKARVDLIRLREGRIDDDDFPSLIGVASRLADSQVALRDAFGMSPLELWSAARALKQEHDTKLIIIDRLEFSDSPERSVRPIVRRRLYGCLR